MSNFSQLEFDLPRALLEQLTELFSRLVQERLEASQVLLIPEEQGVYQLFLDEQLVYIGKTDAEAGLRSRLLRHAKKIQSRLNLDPRRVSFKAVRVYVFTAVDLEELLIKHYRGAATSLAWNLSGFGSNDPGRQRDTSVIKGDHFDRLFPIDLGKPVQIDLPRNRNVATVLQQLKNELPYTIRFQSAGANSRTAHPDLTNTELTLPFQEGSVREVLEHIAAALGNEWQITALPGYVIVYKENKHYPHGQSIRPLMIF